MRDACATQGVNFIDTADVYPLGSRQKDKGESERIVGQWLKERRAAASSSPPKAVGRWAHFHGIGAIRAEQLTEVLNAAETRVEHDIMALLNEPSHEFRMGDASR